jgi:hypothetical protein
MTSSDRLGQPGCFEPATDRLVHAKQAKLKEAYVIDWEAAFAAILDPYRSWLNSLGGPMLSVRGPP